MNTSGGSCGLRTGGGSCGQCRVGKHAGAPRLKQHYREHGGGRRVGKHAGVPRLKQHRGSIVEGAAWGSTPGAPPKASALGASQGLHVALKARAKSPGVDPPPKLPSPKLPAWPTGSGAAKMARTARTASPQSSNRTPSVSPGHITPCACRHATTAAAASCRRASLTQASSTPLPSSSSSSSAKPWPPSWLNPSPSLPGPLPLELRRGVVRLPPRPAPPRHLRHPSLPRPVRVPAVFVLPATRDRRRRSQDHH